LRLILMEQWLTIMSGNLDKNRDLQTCQPMYSYV
jgi:hypothetical protein